MSGFKKPPGQVCTKCKYEYPFSMLVCPTPGCNERNPIHVHDEVKRVQATPLWEGEPSRKDTLHAELRRALIKDVTCGECHTKYGGQRRKCPRCKTNNPYVPTCVAAQPDLPF
jgi:DNA-directed RNA polymerase subunit M/transcription elongation factor TFIIS